MIISLVKSCFNGTYEYVYNDLIQYEEYNNLYK